jgi:hypothetical protein
LAGALIGVMSTLMSLQGSTVLQLLDSEYQLATMLHRKQCCMPGASAQGILMLQELFCWVAMNLST